MVGATDVPVAEAAALARGVALAVRVAVRIASVAVALVVADGLEAEVMVGEAGPGVAEAVGATDVIVSVALLV